ncbi:MAG TPA: hypothetical protein VG323_17750 [Thermoanaerobaculia bacterium]|nr:hypothetical protein [Thermoanaerobaculia bacterium]
MTKRIASIVAAVLAASVFSCKEVNRANAPVQLIVTTQQSLQRLDLKPGAANCDQNIGTVTIKNFLIQNTQPPPNLPLNSTLDDVKITSYRISYTRTDGGTSIPAPFTRSISLSVPLNATGDLGTFLAFQPDALSQAPFAALLPQNGGRDPQTGRPVVQMDVTLEVFGETLAGDRVSGSTRIPLDFCFDCAGCA